MKKQSNTPWRYSFRRSYLVVAVAAVLSLANFSYRFGSSTQSRIQKCFQQDVTHTHCIYQLFQHKQLLRSLRVVLDFFEEKLKNDNDGAFPESITFTLWDTDNIKTYRESLTQVLTLFGVHPVTDSLGRFNKVELIFL